MSLVLRPGHFNGNERDEGSTPSHAKILQWGVSSVVERLIRIQETRVRFSTTPPISTLQETCKAKPNFVREWQATPEMDIRTSNPRAYDAVTAVEAYAWQTSFARYDKSI